MKGMLEILTKKRIIIKNRRKKIFRFLAAYKYKPDQPPVKYITPVGVSSKLKILSKGYKKSGRGQRKIRSEINFL